MNRQNTTEISASGKRRNLRRPAIGRLAVAAVLIVGVAGCSGKSTPAGTSAAPVSAPVAVPELQARDCQPVDGSLVSAVEATLDEGLVLRVATSATDAEGREWLLSSIYRPSDGNRVSSADTWVRIDGVLYAMSGSANEYSNLPDARDLPGVEFDNPTRKELESCATAALRPPPGG